MKKQIARLLYFTLCLTCTLCARAQPLAGPALIDSLRKVLPLQRDDTAKVNVLNSLSHACYSIDPDSGLIYGRQALALAGKLHWPKGRGSAYNNIGTNYLAASDLEQALSNYRQALNIYDSCGNRAGSASATANIGNVYQNLCDFPQALEYYLRALKINESSGDRHASAGNLNNIGLVYQAQAQFDKALEYYLRALKIFEDQGDKKGITTVTGNIGTIYYYGHDYKKALEYEFAQLKQENEQGDKSGVANTEGAIGSSYAGLKDYAAAIAFEQDALKLAIETGDKHLQATQLEYLGFAYLSLITDTGAIAAAPIGDRVPGVIYTRPGVSIPAGRAQRLAAAVSCLQKGLAISKEIGTPDVMKDIYEDLSNASKLAGDYKKAYEYAMIYMVMKDSLFSKDNKEKMEQAASRYEKEHRAAEDARKKQEEAAKRKDQQQRLYWFIIGFLVVLLFVVIVVYRLRADLTRIATHVQDAPDVVVRKMSIVIISIATCFAALLWAWLYYYNIGWTLTTLCPLIYFVIVAPSVLLFFITKKEQLLVNAQLFCIFTMPLIMEWTSGGFKSGVVIDWSILAPIGALIYKGLRAAVWWMALFVTAVIATIIFNDYFSAFAYSISAAGQALFYGMNIIGPSIVIYFSMQFFVRSVIRDGLILQETNMNLSATLGELKEEKQKSDNLLLNILPEQIAEELKQGSQAEARLHNNVTVLLTDFRNFTAYSERHSPAEIVSELHQCFKAFDEIMSRYGIEKIKTIGDGYLAVCGLPDPDTEHAVKAVKAGLEIIAFMEQRQKELGEHTFQVRIGIHSGQVVAGIVGVKKFAYDIWGDTVNIAARMEQNSEPGRINISNATYLLVKDRFTCSYRGEIDAKNKGKMSMYFVER